MTGARRAALFAAVALLALALVVAVVVVTRSGPHLPGPLPVEFSEEQREALRQRQAEDALLRDRLGGLAAVVVDDPALAECTGVDAPVPAPDGLDQVAAVRSQVEQLRGLTLDEPIEVRLLDDAEMTSQVAEVFGRQWDDERLELDQRMLAALGAIPPGTDLAKLRVDAFAEQVSGYYSPGQELIAVRTGDPERLSPLERVVLAHELEHALSDEHLGRLAAESEDATRAVSAVVEGSAVLAMRRYAEAALTEDEQAWLRAELLALAYANPLAGHTPYLHAELRFPYLHGLRYVCQRWRDGGWEAVDEAFAEPPGGTAAVMFPEDPAEPPQPPEPLGEPGGDWQERHADDFGAAQLDWLLAAPGGDPDAAVTATPSPVVAWGGGEVRVWTSGAQTVLGLALVDRGQGPPLCETVGTWYAAAFPDATATPAVGSRTSFQGDSQQAALTCDGDQVRLGIAPDLPLAEAVAG